MRIAVQSDTIYPTPTANGHGLGRAVFNVARELAARGHEVTLFALEGSQLPGGNVVTTPVNVPHGEYDLAERVDPAAFDVGLDAGHLHALAVSRKLPCIAWYQDRASERAPNPVYVSKDLQEYIGPWGPIVRNGIVMSEYPLSRKPRNGRLLFIGSDIWHKGLEQARKVALLTGMELDEYGQGTQGGPIGGWDKVRAMQAAQWLVYPSHIEAGPLTPLEVMACGTPVVALLRAGTVEYVPTPLLGVTPEAMATIIRKGAVFNPRSLRHWVQIGFTVKRQADGFERLLESVAQGATW